VSGPPSRARGTYLGWSCLALAIAIQAAFCALPTMWISVALGGLAFALGVRHAHRGVRARAATSLMVAAAAVTVPLACLAVGLQVSLARHRSADQAREQAHQLRVLRDELGGAESGPATAASAP
jgi:hypothetical protein